MHYYLAGLRIGSLFVTAPLILFTNAPSAKPVPEKTQYLYTMSSTIEGNHTIAGNLPDTTYFEMCSRVWSPTENDLAYKQSGTILVGGTYMTVTFKNGGTQQIKYALQSDRSVACWKYDGSEKITHYTTRLYGNTGNYAFADPGLPTTKLPSRLFLNPPTFGKPAIVEIPMEFDVNYRTTPTTSWDYRKTVASAYAAIVAQRWLTVDAPPALSMNCKNETPCEAPLKLTIDSNDANASVRIGYVADTPTGVKVQVNGGETPYEHVVATGPKGLNETELTLNVKSTLPGRFAIPLQINAEIY